MQLCPFHFFFAFLQVTTHARDVTRKKCSLFLLVIMFNGKKQKVMKITHEVLAETYYIIKYNKNCCRRSIADYKLKCISPIGLIK